MQRVICYKNNVSQETFILKNSAALFKGATNVGSETLEVWEMISPKGIASLVVELHFVI